MFIAGIILFVFQYRKRKMLHIKETQLLNEQHSRELLSAQLKIQTQTMQHIGREIHDNVGQKLTLASLYTKQLQGKLTGASEKINTIGYIIDESLSDLRQLSKSLTNPSLAGLPLAELLQEEADRINFLGNCHVQVSGHNTTASLSPDQKNILFRMLQEFIQNSLKHAACKKIKIDFTAAGNSFTVSATDDGKGFDPALRSNGQGLHNMQRRADELNAVYELKSAPGMGTQLVLQIQLH